MSAPPDRILGSAPQDGDVVVTCDSWSAARYFIRQLPGGVQFSASTREEAVRLVRSFSRIHAVDVWYRQDGAEYLLDTNRAAAASHARVR